MFEFKILELFMGQYLLKKSKHRIYGDFVVIDGAAGGTRTPTG